MTIINIIYLYTFICRYDRRRRNMLDRLWSYLSQGCSDDFWQVLNLYLGSSNSSKNFCQNFFASSCHLPTRKYVRKNMLVFIHLTDTSKSDNELLSSDKIMTAIYLNNIHRVGQVTYIRINSRDLRVWVCG